MASSADLAATLLELAAEDELMARSLLPVEGVTDAGIGLHAQQAVEKSLKAVLAFHGVEFPFTHDLDGLVRLCKKNDIEVPADLTGVDALSPFAVAVRYGTSQSTPLDRKQALRWAGSAAAWAHTIVEDAGGQQGSPADQPSPSD
jgi:HEPN domain-containing protein